jgi:hypothetical protein
MTQTSNTTMGLCIRGNFDGCHDGLMFRMETSSPKASNPYTSKIPMILSTSLNKSKMGFQNHTMRIKSPNTKQIRTNSQVEIEFQTRRNFK